MKRPKHLLILILCGVLLAMSMSACGGGFSQPEPCSNLFNRCTTGTRRFVSDTDRELFYCRECVTTCDICGERATEHFTNLLGRLTFVCRECYN